LKQLIEISQERILYIDDHCVVINKEVGEAAEGAAKGMIDLPLALAGLFGCGKTSGGKTFLPTAVHRLDVPVTGCILFARTPESLAFFNQQFAQRKTDKRYWAVIENPAKDRQLSEQGDLVHWLEVDAKHNKSICYTEEGRNRQKAELHYRVMGRGEHYTFLEIQLITGRHHQIRAQLEAEGLHIKGDLKYGAKRSEKEGGIRLHARSLAFHHPKNDEKIFVTAPILNRDNLWLAFEESVEKNPSKN
jgi:23S rRNA pseudouridine1911/1915/1917 synthase